MSVVIVSALVAYLCPDLEAVKPEYVIQGEQVNCMEYYVNEIINNPKKYESLAIYVKNKGSALHSY